MLEINSHQARDRSDDYVAERQAILEATNDGMDVYAHFGSYFGCEGYPRLDANYPSPFPLEKRYRKSFRLSRGEHGQIVFNDFAAQQMGDCFSFLMKLHGWDFSKAKDYIKNTVLHGWSQPIMSAGLIARSGRTRLVEKPLLSITAWLRENNEVDLIGNRRYDRVGITSAIREKYHCYYLGGALIGNRYADDGTRAKDYTVEHSTTNPLYGYYYPSTQQWKLNRPEHLNKDFRWGPNNVRGKNQPMFGEHLLPPVTEQKELLGVLAPGQRDTMALHALLGCWVGALSSESAHLTPEQYGMLSARFEYLAFFSDDDEAGHKAAAKMQNEWGLKSLNPILHLLGENDLCAWLAGVDGQRIDLRHSLRGHLLEQALC